MVNGINNGIGTTQLFSSSFRPGQSTFQLSENNPRNLLGINPVFEPPSTELREAERQRARNNPFSEENQRKPSQLLSGPTRADVLLGNQSLDRLQADQNAPLQLGGSPLDVEGGSVRLSAGDQSLSIEEGDEARVLENDDGSLTVTNRTSDQSVTFQTGDEVEVEGDGTASITGTATRTIEGGGERVESVRSKSLSFSEGDRLNVSETAEGQARLEKSGTAQSIQLGQQKTNIRVEGGGGDRFGFSNNLGQSIRFSAGDSGSLVTNEDGTVTITNETTGESEVFDTRAAISTGGEARLVLENQAEQQLSFSGNQKGQFTSSESGTLELENTATTEGTSIAERREPPVGERPLRLQTFSNPETSFAEFLQERLINEPDREAREQRRAEAAEPAEAEEEETDPASRDDEEDESILAASFRAESDSSPFAVEDEESDEPFAALNDSSESDGFQSLRSEEQEEEGLFAGLEENEDESELSSGRRGDSRDRSESRTINRRRLNRTFSAGNSRGSTQGFFNTLV
jgi:hypothetical protein